MGNDLTYDLDLSGLVFCRAGLVRLEIAAFGPYDQGGQFLSDLGLKLAHLVHQRLVRLDVAVKRLKIRRPAASTRSSARLPSGRRRSASLPPCVHSCCEGDAARDYWVEAQSVYAEPPSRTGRS